MFNESNHNLIRDNKDKDIFDLPLSVSETNRLIRLRLMAIEIVKGATESQGGLDRLGQIMGFLNNEIESSRNS